MKKLSLFFILGIVVLCGFKDPGRFDEFKLALQNTTYNISSTGTITGEQITSTDDATITDDMTVGGNVGIGTTDTSAAALTVVGGINSNGQNVKAIATVTVCSSTSEGYCDYNCDGTDDSTEIQAAINSLSTNNGTVWLSEGQFNINAKISIAPSENQVINLIGSGLSTKLYKNDNMNDDLIELSGNYIKNGEIKNLYLYGNKANNTSGDGIYFAETTGWYDSQWRLSDLFIEYFNGDGVSMNANYQATELRMTNVYSHRNDGNGYLIYGSDSKVINCIAGNNSQHGFELRDGNGQYTNCKAYGSNYTLADTSEDFYNFLLVGSRLQLIDCQAQDGWKHGIYMSGTKQQVVGCQADTNHNDGTASGTDWSGIVVGGNADYSVIVGNICLDRETPQKQNYGILVSDTVEGAIIAYNQLYDNLTGGIKASATALANNTIFGNKLPASDTTPQHLSASSLILQNSEAISNATNGTVCLTGVGGTNNEELCLDFETEADSIRLSSSTNANLQLYGINLKVRDSQQIGLGTSDDVILKWQTTGLDNYQIGTGVGSDTQTGYISFLEKADIGHANRSPLANIANPTLRIYSSDEAVATDYIEFSHNATNGLISVGSGNLILSPAANVGIGTTTVGSTLTVAGTTSISGNVGIGTTTAATALDVNGAATVRTGGSANNAVCWKSDGITLGYCSDTPNASGDCTCN